MVFRGKGLVGKKRRLGARREAALGLCDGVGRGREEW